MCRGLGGSSCGRSPSEGQNGTCPGALKLSGAGTAGEAQRRNLRGRARGKEAGQDCLDGSEGLRVMRAGLSGEAIPATGTVLKWDEMMEVQGPLGAP